MPRHSGEEVIDLPAHLRRTIRFPVKRRESLGTFPHTVGIGRSAESGLFDAQNGRVRQLNALRFRNYICVTLGDVPRLTTQDAPELCRADWLDGTLSTTEPYIRDRPTNPADAIPDLVACVLPPDRSDEGIPEIAIIPGDESTCTELSLPAHRD